MACFRILESESWDRAAFQDPQGVVIRPTGQVVVLGKPQLEYERLETVAGQIITTDGRTCTDLLFRSRHVGGTLDNGDSIVIHARIDGLLFPVGWFALERVTG